MTIQFLIISFLVLPVPILLRLFPVILPPGVLTELNIILVAGAMANSSVNAIIYLKYNDDIRKKAKVMLGMKPEAVITSRFPSGNPLRAAANLSREAVNPSRALRGAWSRLEV